MKIVIDERGTVVSIQFCCMKFARKVLPTRPYSDAPVTIRQPHGIVEAKGVTFFYCPYCGTKIEKEEVEGELYDPFCSEDTPKDPLFEDVTEL